MKKLTDEQWKKHLASKPKQGCDNCDEGITNPYAQFPEPYNYCDDCKLGKWWKVTLANMTFEIVTSV